MVLLVILLGRGFGSGLTFIDFFINIMMVVVVLDNENLLFDRIFVIDSIELVNDLWVLFLDSCLVEIQICTVFAH